MDEHIPVLVDEVLAGLDQKADGLYIDATFGRGGCGDRGGGGHRHGADPWE